jgi:ketosteroid isomerase-like protein
MNAYRKIIVLVFSCLLVAGADGIQAAGIWNEAAGVGEAEALLEADRAFARATAEKGVEGFASFLAKDVWFLSDGSPFTKGKQAAVMSWAPLLNNPESSITWEPVKADASGELGYTVGQYEIRGKTSEGKAFVERGKYITIWKKQPNGEWKVVIDGGNTDGPPEVEGD